MYKQLIKISNQRKELELEVAKKRADFEDTIALEKAQLDDLKEKENRLKEDVIIKMEEDKMNSYVEDDRTINLQIKKTKQIGDPSKIIESLGDNQKELSDLEIDAIDIITNNFEKQIVVKDKKLILDVSDKLEKVEGKPLDGINVKETKFLTIKNK